MSGQMSSSWGTSRMPGLHRLRRSVAEQTVAVHRDGPVVGHDAAGRDADEGRLAGAVLAHDGEHLALVDLDRHAAQRLDAAVRLEDVDDVQERGEWHRRAGVGRHGGSVGLACASVTGRFDSLRSTCVDQQV